MPIRVETASLFEYAAYGWWAMAPVVGGGASDTTRTLSAHAGMSYGLETFPRDMPGSPAAPLTATWSGRATGHAQDADGRWVLEGDAVLEARLEGPSGAVTGGEIRNMRIAPLDPRSLQGRYEPGGRVAHDRVAGGSGGGKRLSGLDFRPGRS